MPAAAPQDPPASDPALTPAGPAQPVRTSTSDTGPVSSFRSQMDRDFIAKNQIVERYFADKLPARGALDFERFCHDNPEILDELRVAARVQAGHRLMVAGGIPLPWEERPQQLWERLPVAISVAALALLLAIASLTLYVQRDSARKQVATLTTAVQERPIKPITATRTVFVTPGRSAPSVTPSFMTSSGIAELIELRFKMEWSGYTQFRVTIDRVGQGRIMVLNNVTRDSNGQLRLAFNSTSLGPGSYQFAIDGLTLSNEARPQAWFTLGVS